MKKKFIVKDLNGKTLAKCKTTKNQLSFADNCNVPTICLMAIEKK